MGKVLEKFQYHSNKKRIRGWFNYNKKKLFCESNGGKSKKGNFTFIYLWWKPSWKHSYRYIEVTCGYSLQQLNKNINLSLRNYFFPNDLKSAEVSRIFQKVDDLERERELQTCKYSISRVKGLWENNVYSDQQLHRKQIVSLTGRL